MNVWEVVQINSFFGKFIMNICLIIKRFESILHSNAKAKKIKPNSI